MKGSKLSVKRATKIAEHAVGQGWKGKLNSEILNTDQKSFRETVLELTRNDELLVVVWINSEFDRAFYYMFDETVSAINDLATLKKFIFGWPDVLELYALFPNRNRVELTQTYKQIPFDWETASDEEIISNMVGKKVFWYDHQQAKIRTDVVVDIKVKSKVNVIQPVGHRKLFNFNGVGKGFHSLLLDTLIKVA